MTIMICFFPFCGYSLELVSITLINFCITIRDSAVPMVLYHGFKCMNLAHVIPTKNSETIHDWSFLTAPLMQVQVMIPDHAWCLYTQVVPRWEMMHVHTQQCHVKGPHVQTHRKSCSQWFIRAILTCYCWMWPRCNQRLSLKPCCRPYFIWWCRELWAGIPIEGVFLTV
jgi:hypothetical protein